ncbi:MAG: N-formylglutamate amidohydrolase, partial [Planctomycetota bacterium]
MIDLPGTGHSPGPLFELTRHGKSPLVAVALHSGHQVRSEVAQLLSIREADRLREEDPYTNRWTVMAPTRIVVNRSRFEVDLNRHRIQAVYQTPEDSWGLRVWSKRPSNVLMQRSLAQYDAFYREMREILSDLKRDFGRFVVFDLHSYNHRRQGPHSKPEDPEWNPEVNVGTGSLDRTTWGLVVDRFMTELRRVDFMGRRLDVRENMRFRGGYFSRWVHETFPGTGCALAIEVKKIFVDEWSGQPDNVMIEAIGDALKSASQGVLEELQCLRTEPQRPAG